MKTFQQKVLDLIKKIPKGKITTYKILAKQLDSKAYRTVGTACKNNKFAPLIPCHRVINSNSFVGNYSGRGKTKTKIQLLKEEGIPIQNNKIISFKKFLFKFDQSKI